MQLSFYDAPATTRGAEPAQEKRRVVVPGNFDGVHLGHRALLDQQKSSGHVTALTFEPHPLRVLSPERAPGSLTSLERKVELLLAAGADRVAVIRFDRAFAELSPRAFVDEVFVQALHADRIVVGEDFRFGRARAGDVAALRALGSEHGFDVSVLAPVAQDASTVSSTRIRQALTRGDVDEAARCLGRAYDIDSVIVHGQARGRTIGFPTANFALPAELLPARGVYAILGRDLGDRERTLLRGVANLGVRPTVDAGLSLEAHFFDFDADLYGHRVRLAFVARLRDEQRFESVEALRAQIERDVALAKDKTQTLPEWHPWL